MFLYIQALALQKAQPDIVRNREARKQLMGNIPHSPRKTRKFVEQQ